MQDDRSVVNAWLSWTSAFVQTASGRFAIVDRQDIILCVQIELPNRSRLVMPHASEADVLLRCQLTADLLGRDTRVSQLCAPEADLRPP
jgi:hypothetical protein